MSQIFYSLVTGMFFLMNPVHAHDNHNIVQPEARTELLKRDVYTPLFVDFKSDQSCDHENQVPQIEFDGLIFRIDVNTPPPRTDSPYLDLSKESLIQKFWDLAALTHILAPNVEERK